MAGTKLSEFIDGGLPILSKYLCAANSTIPNEKYTLNNVALASNTKTNLVYFSNAGVNNTSTHNGSLALPFQTSEYARAYCKTQTPSPTNIFTVVGDGSNYTITTLTISPFINYNFNNGILTFENVVLDADWATEPAGAFNFWETQFSISAPFTTFDIDFSTFPDNPYFINFERNTILNNFDFNFKLTDSTLCFFNNNFDKTSIPNGTINNIYVDGGNFFIQGGRQFNAFYDKTIGVLDTQVGFINTVSTIDIAGAVNPVSQTILATLNSFIINNTIDNSNGNLLWYYDSDSFRAPNLTGAYPLHLSATPPQAIETGQLRTNYNPVPDPASGNTTLEGEYEGIDAALISSELNADYTPVNYTNTSTKLNGHLEGIDNALTGGGSGDVVGPGSSINGNIATYNGFTGKIIQDSGITVIDTAPGSSGGQILVFTVNGKDLILQGEGEVALTNLSGDLALDSVNNIQLLADNSGTIQVATDVPTVTIESISQSLNVHGDDGLTLSSGGTGTVIIDSFNDIDIAPDTGIVRITTPAATAKLRAPFNNLSLSAANDLLLEYGLDLYLNGIIATQKTTHVTNWQGIWAAPISGNLFYTKIGDQVFLDLPASVSATATIASTIIISTVLPASIRPSITKYFSIATVDAGVQSINVISVNPAGQITIYGSANFGNFTGVINNSGFFGTAIRYFI